MNPDIPIFHPYAHQQEALIPLGNGCKRAVWVWHRRAGKDMAGFLGWMVPEAFRKTGTYFYVFPTYAQGKKIIWDGGTSRGMDDDRSSRHVDGTPGSRRPACHAAPESGTCWMTRPSRPTVKW